MSKVKIQGHASGSGVLTVTAPNTSTDRTITLPDSTGTILDNTSTLDATKLSGNLPAISAASLTNIPAANITGTLPAINGSNLTGVGGNEPYFLATKSSSQSVSDGSWVKITMDTEVFDSGGMFASSRFTPTVAGIYSITVVSGLGSSSDSVWYQGDIAIYKNGSGYASFGADDTNNFGKLKTISVTTLVSMNGSSDYVEAYGNMNTTPGGGPTIAPTHFSGFLIKAT